MLFPENKPYVVFVFREETLAKELKQSKEDRDEIDHQLKEAIEQKIKLSKQLEDWQASYSSTFTPFTVLSV